MRRSASTSSVLACIVFNAPGGLLSTSPGGSYVLGGLALLLLVFQVDTISDEKSAFFVKELSFPQTAPTNDAFFNRNWAGACWGHWAGLGLPLGRLLALYVTLPCKNKRQRGSTGASPVAALMPKSVSF